MSIEAAALAYCQARVIRAECKKVLLDFRNHRGGCIGGAENQNIHTPCYLFYTVNESEHWCEVCADSQPLYEAKRRAAIEVGKALRKLAYVCRKQSLSEAAKEVQS